MRVLLFGIMKEIAAAGTLDIAEPLPDVGQLRAWLLQQYPAMKNLRAVMVAVNRTYAPDGQPLAPGDEIAIIPPLSGG